MRTVAHSRPKAGQVPERQKRCVYALLGRTETIQRVAESVARAAIRRTAGDPWAYATLTDRLDRGYPIATHNAVLCRSAERLTALCIEQEATPCTQ